MPLSSVRTLLLWLVCACLLPGVIGAVALFSFQYQEGRAQLQKDTIQTARALIQTVDTRLLQAQSVAQTLSTSPHLAMGEFAAFHRRARELLQTTGIGTAITLTDESGQQLLNTKLDFGAPLPPSVDLERLHRIFSTGQPVISDVFIGQITGRPLVSVHVPVLLGGKVVYDLGISILSEDLNQILRKQHLAANWIVAISDRTGTMAARTHAPERFIGKKAAPEFIERMLAAPEGALETMTREGIPVLTMYSRSPLSGWSVVIGIPRASLEAQLMRGITFLGVGIATLFGVGIGLAWLMADRIAHSVRALTAPAIALAAGEALVVSKVHFREADEVAKAMAHTAQLLMQGTRALQESEGRYRALVEWSPEAIIIFRDGKVLYVNLAAIEMFGARSAQDLIGKSIFDFIHPDFRQIALARMNSLAGYVGGLRMIEGKLIHFNGTVIDIEVQNTAIVYDGDPAIHSSMRDITARKRVELDMQQQQKEIMHLSRVTMLGELSGALAHELNQPLTAILSNAQAAQRFLAKGDFDEVRDILQDIVDEDKRAGEVIRRLRRLFDKGETARQSVDLNEVVLEVVHFLRIDLTNQGVALTTELAPVSPLVCADRVQLQQILINLVMNACDAMASLSAPERRITVRTALIDECVQVSVIDCGMGIASASLEKIFQPFYTTKEHGMGLGLSICRNIADANGGQLWGENNPQRGASFHVRMPLLVKDTL